MKDKINYPRKIFWGVLALSLGMATSELKIISETIIKLSETTLQLKDQIPLLLQRIKDNKLELLKLKEELKR